MNRFAAAALTAGLFAVVVDAADCQAPPSMLSLIRDPLVTEAVHRRIARQRTDLAPDGASALSREWVEGKRKDWFIENQRGGGDMIDAGVVLGDHKLIDTGLREFEWGFARQGKDGSFPETGDPFHSVSIYVLETARALLVLREKRGELAEFIPRMEKMIPQVGAAAAWLLEPAVLEPSGTISVTRTANGYWLPLWRTASRASRTSESKRLPSPPATRKI